MIWIITYDGADTAQRAVTSADEMTLTCRDAGPTQVIRVGDGTDLIPVDTLVTVLENGDFRGTRRILNFIGATVADNIPDNRVDVTISAGGSWSRNFLLMGG